MISCLPLLPFLSLSPAPNSRRPRLRYGASDLAPSIFRLSVSPRNRTGDRWAARRSLLAFLLAIFPSLSGQVSPVQSGPSVSLSVHLPNKAQNRPPSHAFHAVCLASSGSSIHSSLRICLHGMWMRETGISLPPHHGPAPCSAVVFDHSRHRKLIST